MGRARQLLDRIGGLARQARETAEGLAGRLLPGGRDRSGPAVESEPALEPESVPAPVPESVPAPAPVSELAPDVGHDPAERTKARVVLLSRDPEWVFCYWDVEPAVRSAVKAPGSRLTLRLHDVTDIDFDGTNGWSQHLYPLTEEARWWHVPVPHRGRHYLAEVGYCTPEGTFFALGRSEAVATLSDQTAPSDEVEMATVHIDAPLTGQAPHRPAVTPEKQHLSGDASVDVSEPAPGAPGKMHHRAAVPHALSSAALSHPGSAAIWSRRR